MTPERQRSSKRSNYILNSENIFSSRKYARINLTVCFFFLFIFFILPRDFICRALINLFVEREAVNSIYKINFQKHAGNKILKPAVVFEFYFINTVRAKY